MAARTRRAGSPARAGDESSQNPRRNGSRRSTSRSTARIEHRRPLPPESTRGPSTGAALVPRVIRAVSAISSTLRVTKHTRCMSTAAPRSGRSSTSCSQRRSASSRDRRASGAVSHGRGVFMRFAARYNRVRTKETHCKVTETTTVVSGPVAVTDAAAGKIQSLLADEQKNEAGLRVFVQGGGCSGFQYGLMIEEGAGDAESDTRLRVERRQAVRGSDQRALSLGSRGRFRRQPHGRRLYHPQSERQDDLRVRTVVRCVALGSARLAARFAAMCRPGPRPVDS